MKQLRDTSHFKHNIGSGTVRTAAMWKPSKWRCRRCFYFEDNHFVVWKKVSKLSCKISRKLPWWPTFPVSRSCTSTGSFPVLQWRWKCTRNVLDGSLSMKKVLGFRSCSVNLHVQQQLRSILLTCPLWRSCCSHSKFGIISNGTPVNFTNHKETSWRMRSLLTSTWLKLIWIVVRQEASLDHLYQMRHQSIANVHLKIHAYRERYATC